MKKMLLTLFITLFLSFACIDGMELTISPHTYILQLPEEVIIQIAGCCQPSEKNKLMKICTIFYVWLQDTERILVVNPSTVSTKDKKKALFKYIHANNINMITFLLNNGVDVHCKNILGMTPLHVAYDCNHEETIRLLIDRGADKNEPRPGLEDLQKAAYKGEEEIFKVLLSNHNPHFMTSDATSPLSIAASEGHLTIIKLLCENKFNNTINSADMFWWTALTYACDYNHMEAVQLLLSAGAHVNHVTNSQWSPLCFAVSNGNFELVQLLINSGAKINKTLKPNNPYNLPSLGDLPINNNTPLQIAQEKGYTDIVTLLQKDVLESTIQKDNSHFEEQVQCDTKKEELQSSKEETQSSHMKQKNISNKKPKKCVIQ